MYRVCNLTASIIMGTVLHKYTKLQISANVTYSRNISTQFLTSMKTQKTEWTHVVDRGQPTTCPLAHEWWSELTLSIRSVQNWPVQEWDCDWLCRTMVHVLPAGSRHIGWISVLLSWQPDDRPLDVSSYNTHTQPFYGSVELVVLRLQ